MPRFLVFFPAKTLIFVFLFENMWRQKSGHTWRLLNMICEYINAISTYFLKVKIVIVIFIVGNITEISVYFILKGRCTFINRNTEADDVNIGRFMQGISPVPGIVGFSCYLYTKNAKALHIILLEGAIRRWENCGHKEMDLNNAQLVPRGQKFSKNISLTPLHSVP